MKSSTFAAFRGVVLLLAAFAAPEPAEAAITFVQGLGTGGTPGAIATSATVTTTGTVTAGNSIFVFVATNNGSDAITCSDPVNGTYTTDVNNGSLQTAVCSKHNALALPSGSVITVSMNPFPTNIRISVAEFSGLAAASQLDRTAVANGISTSPSATLGAATCQANELLIGVVNVNNLGAAIGFTPGSNNTANNCTNTGSTTYENLPSATGQNSVFPIYCIVNATGNYRAAGSLTVSNSWTVAMATYRAPEEATSTSISPSAATVTDGTAQTFTATVTVSGVPVTGGTVTFVDMTTSTTLASGVALNGSGQAATTVTLAPGGHTIQATYNPDCGHLGSSNTTSVTVNASADLAISKSAAASVTVGQNIVYTITATNGGPSTAASVSVGDVLPAGVTFVSATPTQGSCSGTSTVTCSLGSLVSGATATVTLTVSTSASTGASVSNTATVGSSTADPNLANNSSTATTTVNASADLAISKSAAASVTAGQNIVYTITATNGGPSAAASVSVGDVLPAGVTFVSATPTQGSCSGTSTVTCSLGSLSSGASATVTLTVSTSGSTGASVSNTATAGSSTADPNLANNASTATTTVNASADLAISKSATASVTAGQNIVYTITATNGGPSAAASVSVGDVLPSGVTFVSATPTQGTCSGTSTVTCSLGSLSSGATATVTLTVSTSASTGASVSNTATVSSSTADPSPANNSSIATTAVSHPVNSFTGPTATGSGNATVTFTGGGVACSFAPAGTGPGQSSFFIPVSGHPKSPPAPAAGVVFPHGLLDFVLVGCTSGSTVTFTVTYPTALPADAQYRKYGPTASLTTPHWYILPATLSGNTAVFSITDGGEGDDDLTANGTIVDQGGPGSGGGGAGASGIPTLSEWALLLLASLLLAMGWRSSARIRK